MRNFQLSALMLIVVLTFFQRPAQAQQGNPNADNTRTSNSQTGNSELREKAFAVLESLAGQLNTLQSAENRARIAANIAESLWKRDETRARALFLLVQQDIRSRLVIPDDFEDPKQMQTFLVFLKLRSDTLERLIKYDAELAFSFFKATEVDLDKLPRYLADSERNVDLRLSQKLAAQNPEIAVRLARLSLARGFSHDLLMTLFQLSRHHKQHALVLYKQIVQKLRNANLKEDWSTRQFVSNLARHFQPPMIDELAFRDFVGFAVATAGANGCDGKPAGEHPDFCQWTASVLASVEKFDPRPAGVKRQTLQHDGYERERRIAQMQSEVYAVAEEGTVDEVLALAGKYPDIAGEIYWHAFRMARKAGDLDRMRKIAEDFNGVPEGRQRMLNEVAQAQRDATFDEEQLAQLQAQLNEPLRPEERVRLLVMAAHRAGASNRKLALQLINRAEQIVETMGPGKDQSMNQIGLAMLYCLEKDDRGFTIMEALVPKLNSLVDAAVKLDGYDTAYIRDEEWNMSSGGSLGQLLTQLSAGAEFFAWSDFDRAMRLAAQFERTEIRMMAQLKLAQGILAGPHKRSLVR